LPLKRFRIEVEGSDQEDVEEQLDDCALVVIEMFPSLNFECTDEHISPIQRNGIPLMHGRRVFKTIKADKRLGQ
jgi:hypothetical protein